MKNLLGKLFKLEENSTTIRTEISGGTVTFLTMSYIIFLQPAILSQAKMDFNSVMVATCLSAALASVLMGLLANYPIALAPGMGENFFFAFTVVIMLKVSWQQALGIVFISGVIFILLTLFKIREKFVNSIPASLKHGIAAGIGMLIGFIGLSEAGIIIRNNAPLHAIAYGKDLSAETVITKLNEYQYSTGAIKIGDLGHPATLIALIGLLVTIILVIKNIKGAILWGILTTALFGLLGGIVKWQGLISAPPSISPTFFKLSFKGLFSLKMIPIVIVFFIMDFFDTIGTLIGVSSKAGFYKNNKLPRASKALMADAIGTVSGALLGTSTVTSYIESVAGVKEGSRTGLSAVTTGVLFLLAIFFAPLIAMIGKGYQISAAGNIFIHPVTAPALIIVAAFMAREMVKIKWDDYSESIPAFLTFIGMPLTYSVGDGLAFGFISYTLIKLLTGKFKDLNIILIVVTVLFILKFFFVKI